MQIHNYRKSNYFLLFMLLVVVASCSKDDAPEELPPNLAASLTQETIASTVSEGDFVVFNYNLTKILSEDLPLTVDIDTRSLNLPVDDDDYKFEFQFKGDFETTWRTSTTPNIFFPKGNISMKIRIQIVDDKIIEVDESFLFSIDLGESNINFDIMGAAQLEPIMVTILNDDGLNLIRPGSPGEIANYSVDENYNFAPIRVNSSFASYSEKALFDKLMKEGVPEEIKADLKKVFDSAEGDVTLKEFTVLADSNLMMGGFVAHTSDNLKDWQMGLNISFAYPNLSDLDPSSKTLTEDVEKAFSNYNDGAFGYIMIHEFGHIVSLNYLEVIPRNDMGELNEECTAEIVEGCLREGSVAFGFEAIEEASSNFPINVSTYASTNFSEDIAETFAWAVIQDDIPMVSVDGTSSVALQKMNFINKYPHYVKRNYRGLRDKINADFTKIIDPFIGPINSPVFNYNPESGEHISCVRKRSNVQ